MEGSVQKNEEKKLIDSKKDSKAERDAFLAIADDGNAFYTSIDGVLGRDA